MCGVVCVCECVCAFGGRQGVGGEWVSAHLSLPICPFLCLLHDTRGVGGVSAPIVYFFLLLPLLAVGRRCGALLSLIFIPVSLLVVVPTTRTPRIFLSFLLFTKLLFASPTAQITHTQMGLWGDNLVFTFNIFDPNNFVGAAVMAIKRSDLIAGVASPKFVNFNPFNTASSLLPGNVFFFFRLQSSGGKSLNPAFCVCVCVCVSQMCSSFLQMLVPRSKELSHLISLSSMCIHLSICLQMFFPS
jgi:hypothetical protein